MIRRLLALALLLPSLALGNVATYEAAVLADSPVLLYKLNETSGTTITNYGSSGSAYNLTTTGTPTLNQSRSLVVGGTSVLFNGSSQWAEFLSGLGGCTLDLTADRSWEVIGSVHGNGSSGNADGVAFSSYGPSKPGWVIYVLARSGVVIGQICTYNSVGGSYTGPGCATSAGTSGVADTMYHLAASWTVATTTMKFYLNGVLGDTDTTVSGSPGCAEHIDVATYDTATHQSKLNGNVQYASFYSSALSGATILAHYNAALAVPTYGLNAYSVHYFDNRYHNRRLEPIRFVPFPMDPLVIDAPGFIVERLNRKAMRSRGVYQVGE